MFADAFNALRPHIVAIAMCATVVFGFLFKGVYPVGLALLCGLDWCIVNLLNRATDVEEDRLNAIVATEFVARHARAIVWGSLAVLVGSLGLGFLWLPATLAWVRVLFHAIGLGYSFRYVPTPWGFKRFKDLYALKNGMSVVLFLLSVGGYPLLGYPARPTLISALGITLVLGFFFFFELTFEVIYDLRDLDGDRAVGVPTFPVVHGISASAGIVYSFCVVSVLLLVAGRALHAFTTRELLMAAAPLAQIGFLRWRGPDKVTRNDCIGITYGGAVLLLFFLAGTWAWARAGLPMDI